MQQFLKTTIKELLIEWQNRPLPRPFFRDSSKINLENMYNILAILGPRRAGKTYFMYQLIFELIEKNIASKDEILFIDFENYRLIELQTRDIGEILNIFYEIHGKYPKYLFFDEIHTIENWGKVLRTFHNDGYNIIVSGSSSKLLLNEISTELRGRYVHKLMLPFSFSEIVEQNDIKCNIVQFDKQFNSEIVQLFEQYLEFGGFPLVIKEKNTYRKVELLEDYYSSIFYKDILDRYNIKDKKSIEFMLNYLLNIYSCKFSISKFEKYLKTLDIGTSKGTLVKYADYIEESFFTIKCSKFTYSPKGEIVNPNKIYLIDPGFIRLGNNYSKDNGKILENIVAIELYRREKKFFYFDETKECDFVIKDKIGTNFSCAIQVTRLLNLENKKREISGLMQALEKCNLDEGYILTFNEFDEIEKNGKIIHIIPVWKWLLEKEN